MSATSGVATLADERFVSLSTFRRSGDQVATPVWAAVVDTGAGGPALVVTTGSTTGKVKRIGHTPEVTLRPCSRRGAVADDAPTVTAHAEVLDDPVAFEAGTAAIRAKYGLEFRVVMLLERLFSRGGGHRVIVRLTDPPAGD